MTTNLTEIHAIADQLHADGTEPSVRAVARALGVQNTGLIGAGLNDWRARKADLAEAADMPDAFRSELELFGVRVLRAAREDGELQARIMSEQIRRLHKAAADREEEILAQAMAQDETVKVRVAASEAAWQGERASWKADAEAAQVREKALMERVETLEAELEKAIAKAEAAEAAKGSAEDRLDAADIRLANLRQETRRKVEELEAENRELKERAIEAEKRLSVCEGLLTEANERAERDKRRIDGLVANIVAIAGKQGATTRRNDPPRAQA